MSSSGPVNCNRSRTASEISRQVSISGRTLSGEEFPYPENWDFTNDHFTIAVETRPEDPHSVTTVCFVHEGALYVPAQSGSSKRWPAFPA